MNNLKLLMVCQRICGDVLRAAFSDARVDTLRAVFSDARVDALDNYSQ